MRIANRQCRRTRHNSGGGYGRYGSCRHHSASHGKGFTSSAKPSGGQWEQLADYVLEYAPAAIAILDRELRYLMINERFRADFELGDLDVTGLNHFEVFTGLAEQWKVVCRRCLGGAVERGEDDPLEQCDGRIDFVRWECRPWRDPWGEIGGIVLFLELVTDQKRARNLLRESEIKFRRCMIDSPLPVMILAEDGEILLINNAWTERTGYTLDDIPNIDIWTERAYGEKKEEVRKYIKSLFELDKKVDVGEYTITSKSGEKIIWNFYCSPLGSQPDGRRAIICASVDVTERKQAEERLRESERRLADIIDFLPDATFGVDREGRVIIWNRAHEAALGIKTEYAIGKTTKEISKDIYGASRPLLVDYILHPSPDIVNYYPSYQKIGDTLTAKICLPNLQGEDNYHWLKATPLYDFNNTIVGAIETVRNITEQKITEENLRESERRLSDIIDFLPDATFVVDNEGRVIAWNKAIQELTKIPASEMVGKSNYECAIPFYGERRPMLVDCAIHPELLSEGYYGAIEREGGVLVTEVCLPHFQGRPTYFWVKATTLYDSNGNIIGGIEAIRNTTDRKLAEEKVRQLNEELEKRVEERTRQLEISNKELEAFSYSVSHDLRAPLRSINGFSQILLDECRDSLDESGRDYLNRILAAGQRMGQLIEDLLGLSRVTRREMVRTRVDLSEVARSVLAGLTAGAPTRQVELIISQNIQANGDPGLLRIVMENLLGNAWKFTSHHPTARIEFGMRLRDNTPEYFVRDDGAGFDMKIAEKLFAPFQRLHRAEDFSGVGIGLTTVERIIHRHGGWIWAESEVEKGATFYFTLGPENSFR